MITRLTVTVLLDPFVNASDHGPAKSTLLIVGADLPAPARR